MLGKVEGKRKMGRLRIRQLYSITDSLDMNLSKLQELVEDNGAWCATVHGVARRTNQSILKEISPQYSLEGLMLKLKPQYFGHLMQ